MEKIVTLKLTLHNYKKIMFPHCYLHNDVFIRLKTHTQLCAKLLGAIDILNQSSPKLPIRKCTMLHWQCTMVHFLIDNKKKIPSWYRFSAANFPHPPQTFLGKYFMFNKRYFTIRNNAHDTYRVNS